MGRIRSHLTYANVISTLCLFLLLGGGSAIALAGSNTVFSDDIVNDQVKSADVRNDNLAQGGLAALDLREGSVRGSEVLDDSLSGADVNESSFGVVPDAAHATNSDRLGDRAAAGYQRRVTGTCNGGAIRAINGGGAVDCIDQAVFPISEDLNSDSNNYGGASFFPSNLSLLMRCNPSSAAADFINNGFGGATLNWIFSQGQNFPTSTVNASGTSVPGRNGANVITFAFTNRVEGQWIFADADGVTTVNLHGFIAPGSPSFCEFKGTAEWAPLG